jgi:hypothetical protein
MAGASMPIERRAEHFLINAAQQTIRVGTRELRQMVGA